MTPTVTVSDLPTKPSLLMRLVVAMLRAGGTKAVLSDDARIEQEFRRTQAAGPAPVPRSVLRTCTVETATIGGLPVTTVTPRRPAAPNPAGRPFLYLHGGGYVHPIIAHHWRLIAALAVENDCAVTVPLYRPAPAGDVLGALAALDEVYSTLLGADRAPVVGGDSAGGGLTLALTHQLAAQGRPGPAHLVLLAPWLDVELTNPGIAAVDPRDPTLAVPGLRHTGRLWANGLPLDDPRVSPIHLDPAELPPSTIVVGTRDIFVADCRDFTARAQRAGADVQLLEFPDAFHVFIAGTFLPESRIARRMVAARLAAR